MESALLTTATVMSVFTTSKPLDSNSGPLMSQLHRRLPTVRPIFCRRSELGHLRVAPADFQGLDGFRSVSLSRNVGGSDLRPLDSRLECVSSSAASFASGGHERAGGSDGSGGNGGGGDGAADGVKAKGNVAVGGAEHTSALSSDAVILDVDGMTCGGCAASAKKILESQVSSASINLTTETAIVWPVSEAKAVPNWQKNLGEAVGKHLTSCGFQPNLRGQKIKLTAHISSLTPWQLNSIVPPSAYSSSQSHSFLISQSRAQAFDICRATKLGICCSQHTIQPDSEQTNLLKKSRRKPRPSFLEQIEEKWSLKTTSLRDKLPWQEEKRDLEEIEEQEPQLSEVVPSGSEIENDFRDKVISAPFDDGNLPRKDRRKGTYGSAKPYNSNVFSSVIEEPKSLQRLVTFDDENEVVVKNHATPLGFSQQNETLAVRGNKVGNFNGNLSSINQDKGVNFEGKYEEKADEFGATNVRKLVEHETLAIEDDEGVSFGVKPSSILQEFDNVKGAGDSVRLPWKTESEGEAIAGRLRKSNTEVAEKLIPEPELKRLRNVALRMVERTKVGMAGITQALVDSIHEKWEEDEVVKLKFDGPQSKNMKRTHELLESRTGGLIIWRSGSSVVLYRGMGYKFHCVQSYAKESDMNTQRSASSRLLVHDATESTGLEFLVGAESSEIDPEARVELNELNFLLDELGPRFKDWSGRDPVPVDADLLPPAVPGYRPPFRLLPYGVRPSLHDKDMTNFRRTARTMPPHFALGRNRELQGLAMAMVKLWERSSIAKIAIKRGVPNTSNERMAEELKVLTGGTLVSRNKDYIVFYRGNDFLPPGVLEALAEAEKLTVAQQDKEEQARQRAVTFIHSGAKAAERPLVAGTLSESMAATSRWAAEQPSSEDIEKMMRDAAVARQASLVKFLEQKLAIAKGKIRKAEKALQKLQGNLEPADLPTDLETLTAEERFLFRKMGLSMKPFLVLGRRGLFDGTVENMHLHWKYRELVKILVERKTLVQVKHIAISLEAESGGVLVSIEKTTKGHAIIIYRGKNYRPPRAFRPRNLLTKRQALAQSIELQRREALKHHVSELQEKIEKLKFEIEHMRTVEGIDGKTLYSRLDASDDEEEDEGNDLDLEEL